MFVVVEEHYGATYAYGPYDTREDAEQNHIRPTLRELVDSWGHAEYSMMTDEELMVEWRENTYDLFEDTDSYIEVVLLQPAK
jgi:hypothetical protein